MCCTHVVDPQEAGINRSPDRRSLVFLQRVEVDLGSGHEGLLGRGEPGDLGNHRVDAGGAGLLGLEGGRANVPVGVGGLEHCHVDHPGRVGGAEAGGAGGLEDQGGVEGGNGELEVDDAAADGRASDSNPPLQGDVVKAGIGAACQVELVSKQVAASGGTVVYLRDQSARTVQLPYVMPSPLTWGVGTAAAVPARAARKIGASILLIFVDEE